MRLFVGGGPRRGKGERKRGRKGGGGEKRREARGLMRGDSMLMGEHIEQRLCRD
jgi:hypothetical protein